MYEVTYGIINQLSKTKTKNYEKPDGMFMLWKHSWLQVKTMV